VEVSRGQVEVSDFKSGQIAQVMPGQAATAFATGQAGLSLSGSGTFNPIEHGSPRVPTIDRVPVPKDGLHAPRDAMKGSSIHALNTIGAPAAAATRPGVVRLSTSLGEVNLNVGKATHGLAHGGELPGVRTSSSKDTVWSDAKASAGNNGNSAAANANASSTAVNTPAASTTSASTTSAVTTAIGSANASGNGSGNGNGNGNGATGNGKGSGNSNAGGNGNGNGGGNGNGNASENNNGKGNGGENNGKGKKS
jgi:hypothetical protein